MAMGFSQRSESVSVVAQGSEGGGAALDQVIGMSVVALVVTAGLLWIGYLHRQRRITWLNNLAEWAGRKFKRPPWVALPMALFIATLICALFGFIWDVSLHIGKGRDPGPLANPAHYFILFGLFLLFVAGCLACVLPYDKPGPSAVRITDNWYAPVGGILMTGCGLYALTGFPLDDIWHRIFGQDVTLWGPTHLMMIGGAGFSTLSAIMLNHEGLKAMGDDAPTGGLGIKFIQYLGFGGVIVGLSVYQIEFDFGVPQFRQVFQPMLIAAAAALALVAARIMLGRGAAIIAALLAIVLRGGVAFVVGPILGAPINWFALYRCRRRADRPDAADQASPHIRRRQRARCQHDRTVARVVLDRRGVPLSVANQHLARGAGHGHPRRDPHRCLRRHVRFGPHLTGGTSRPKGRGTAAVACHQHRSGGAHRARNRRCDC
jgi:hypothetical protein